jgi:hypothetical protein
LTFKNKIFISTKLTRMNPAAELLPPCLNAETLATKLSELTVKGFDRIKFPGGTSKDKLYYSGVLIYKFDGKKLCFLTVPYNSSFHTKNPDENGNKKTGETPEQTACREIMEEVGIIISPEHLTEIESARLDLPPLGSKPGHTKYFFLSPFMEKKEKPFVPALPDDETGEPMWVELDILLKVLYHGHAKALRGAAEMMAMDRDLCNIVMKALQ